MEKEKEGFVVRKAFNLMICKIWWTIYTYMDLWSTEQSRVKE